MRECLAANVVGLSLLGVSPWVLVLVWPAVAVGVNEVLQTMLAATAPGNGKEGA